MKMRHVGILASVLAIGAIAAPLPSFAEVKVMRVLVDVPPPEAKVSTPPTPTKVGYVWSPGYWNWDGSKYVAVEGNWVAVVEKKKWVAPVWNKEDNKWYFTAGHWE